MTNWLASTSLKNTSWPVSGHLIQRFSGVSRRLRMLRIFGRTTLEIQFIGAPRPHSNVTSRRSNVTTVNRKSTLPQPAWGKLPERSNPRLIAGMRSAHAVGERRDQVGHRLNALAGGFTVSVKTRPERINQR